MAVTVHLPGILSRHAGGARTLTADGATVAAVLDAVASTHPELGRRIREATSPAAPFLAVYLNDEDIRFLGGAETAVHPGDELALISAIAGG